MDKRTRGSPEAARNPQTQPPQDEVALTTQGASAVSNPGDNVITGREFPDAKFGPVTQDDKTTHKADDKTTHKAKVTQIAKQVIHHHHYGPEESSAAHDEPSTSQERKISDVLHVTGSLKIFKNQKLHLTSMIYKGEKTTVAEPIPVAVKLMNYTKLVVRKAKSLHSIDSHPNVVKIYDSGIVCADIKVVFIAMELCSSETLFDYVHHRNESFDPRLAIDHSTQIISGLEYIHNRGIAHWDIKPQNILFSATGGYHQVKISGFGFPKYCDSLGEAAFPWAVGTHGFMAAELINEKRAIDPIKCDIFSLGIVLVFRLSDGKHPYGEEFYDWNYNIASGRDPNLHDIRLPNKKQMNDIKRLISKMLQHSPKNRPAARDLMKEWNKDVCGIVKEASRETLRARSVQDVASDQEDREETAMHGYSHKMDDAVDLSKSIKFFKNLQIHEGKLIFEGEKATEMGPIPLVVKLIPFSDQVLQKVEFLPPIDAHPNVVKIYDFGLYDSDVAKYVFIAMELCSKVTILDYVSRSNDFDAQLAIEHSTQLISGLEHLHRKGLAHGDIKPHNVLFDAKHGFKQLKINDFDTNLIDPNLAGRAFGTIGYTAPEIATGKKHTDPKKCDVFSLGILLVFILSNGKHPYGDQPWEWNYNIANLKKPNFSQILLRNRKQRYAVVCILEKMLQNDPERRLTIEEVQEDWEKNALDSEDDVSISDSFSADISPNGGEILFDKCHITFPEKCFEEVTRTEGKLEVAPHKCPSQYIPITPMLYLESSNSPKKPISVKLASWCVNDGSDEGKAVKVHVLHLPMGSDDWEIIAKLPLGDTAEFDFYASDLSPFIVGLPKLFFGPQEFLIEGFLRATRSDDFEFLFFLKHSWFESITGQRDYSQMETEKLKTFNTLRVKRGDKIQVHISAENVNFVDDGKGEFTVDEKYIKEQKLWQFSTFIDDDDTVCSRKLVLRCTIHHNDTNFPELRFPYYPKRGEQGTKGNQSQAANIMVTGGSTYISRNKNCSNETTVKR